LIAEQVKTLSKLVYKETHGQPGVNGTGTTVVLALVDSAQATIVHAGDSRAYLLRQGELQQVTQDHTLGQLLVRNHQLSASAVGQHPAARRLTRYVGMPAAVAPDWQTIDFVAGDLLLLCSDGLHGQINDDEISRILRSGKGIEEMGRELVAAGNRAGGRDNVTVLLISPKAGWLGHSGVLGHRYAMPPATPAMPQPPLPASESERSRTQCKSK
jgi:protein phosphatase